ncbi:MAG: sulfatase [Planctomycetaceae bacterium]|nr:sulfatase [Planctomycetaceae bacterium]
MRTQSNTLGFVHRTRREFLRSTSTGFGMLAFAGLTAERSYAGLASQPHFAPKAKHVIFCFMDGGPSHVDTLDYKPMLTKREGTRIGDTAVSKLSQSNASRVWLGSPWKFRQRGQSGLWVSDLFPHAAELADELCVVRSLVGKQPLHGQQALLLHTGRETGRAPSLGSWTSYGLGTENDSLPGYVLLNNDWIPNGGYENFASSFLPATHAATLLRAKGTPVDNIVPTDKLAIQRRKLDLLRDQDRQFAAASADEQAIEAAIANYETAFRMQSAIPDIANVSDETEATKKLYGFETDNELKEYYSLQCLRARRLVEAGVRFIEITCPLTHANNSPWDQHSNIKKYHEGNAMITDQAVAALIIDLKQRGLLEDTIVVWAGEMGRTPHTPAISPTCGRDHHVNGYSIFMAGGGFRGGTAFGKTDEFGNSVVENQLTIHDIHATILHQLGLDHKRLTFRFGGRDASLTDIHGRVVNEILS